MSFWSTSSGTNLAAQTREEAQKYDPPTNDIELIPAGSVVRAFIKEAKWKDTPNGEWYVELRWDVVKPESVANRVVFQKLWVKSYDPNAKKPDEKRDKAKHLLIKIDAIAGGKLAAKGTEPTDDDLAIALQDKLMVIVLQVWEMKGSNGELMSGNWVQNVLPCEGTELIVKDAKPPKPTNSAAGDLDDDIPF